MQETPPIIEVRLCQVQLEWFKHAPPPKDFDFRQIPQHRLGKGMRHFSFLLSTSTFVLGLRDVGFVPEL